MDDCLAIRNWIIANCSDKHPVRDAAYKTALSAFVHRFIKYGPEQRLDDFSARDILNMAIMQQDDTAAIFMRTAFTRAIIENDIEVVNELCRYDFIPECKAWYKSVVGMILWAADQGKLSASIAEGKVDELSEPDKSVGRLLIARSFPGQMKRQWLEDCPSTYPRMQAELLSLLNLQKKEREFCESWIKGRVAVAMSVS